jgi:hypothetical protein
MERKITTATNLIKNKYIRWIAIASFALLTIFKWPAYIQHRKNIEEIKKGRLEYTTNWWWIDRWHATSWWAHHLWEDINNPKDIPNTDIYGLVSYGQYWRLWWLKKGVEKQYIVRKDLNMVEKKAVALAIFLEVSQLFEEYQAMFDIVTWSSFNESDIFSNVIWFYRGVEWYTRSQVEHYLEPVWVDSSLAIYYRHGIGKNTNIGTVMTYVANDTIRKSYPCPFNQILTVRKWRFIEKWILFKDANIPKSCDRLTFFWYDDCWFDVFIVNKKYEYSINNDTIIQRLKDSNPEQYETPKITITKHCQGWKVVVSDL